MGKKICIIVGHGGKDKGAYNKSTKETELDYNWDLAPKVKALLEKQGYIADIHNRGNATSENIYGINKLGYDIIVSLHCNAYNGYSNGTEVLYWNTSTNGKRLAQALQDSIVQALGLQNRGLKPIKYGDRGAYLLGKTRAVAVLIEPFFIDNDKDFKVGKEKKNEYAISIVNGINKYFKG